MTSSAKKSKKQTDILVDQFISHLRVEKGLSDNTIQSYSSDLVKFLNYLEEKDLSPLEITRDDIITYMGNMKGKLSERSAARNLSSLKIFFRFMMSEGTIKENPVRLLESMKLPRKLPEILTPDEVEALLLQPDVSTH